MRILAFSDLHRDTDIARQLATESASADVVVIAGDFGTRGIGARDTLDVLKATGKPTVIVSGNHDRLTELRSICADWPDGHLLHGEAVAIDGKVFFGLGGEVPMRSDAAWNESLTEDEASRLLWALPTRAVLVTHTPPFGHADQQNDGTHEGSEAILSIIKECSPVLALCGHIHAAWGATSRIGETPIHNLGPTANWFDL